MWGDSAGGCGSGRWRLRRVISRISLRQKHSPTCWKASDLALPGGQSRGYPHFLFGRNAKPKEVPCFSGWLSLLEWKATLRYLHKWKTGRADLRACRTGCFELVSLNGNGCLVCLDANQAAD